MKKSNLKAESYITLENEKTIKYSSFYKQIILKNISKALSNYYSNHPDEINNLK